MKIKYLIFVIIGIIFISGCAPEEIVEEPQQEIAAPIINEETEVAERERFEEEMIVEENKNVENFDDENCEDFEFTEYLVDPSYVQKVGQIGVVHGSGQFTVGRSYISLKDDLGLEKVPVYAPTEMVLRWGSYYENPASVEIKGSLPDYALRFDAGCDVEITLAHLKEVVDSIAQQLPDVKPDSRQTQLDPIIFKAGDLIGYFIQNSGVAGFDFMIHDINVVNQFANQERYETGSSNILNAVCPYDFYKGERKKAYYDLIGGGGGTLFEVKECGPASRDFPGTISGQWFLDEEVLIGIYDYYKDGDYPSVLPIVGDEERITIGSLGEKNIHWVYPNNPTYKDLKDVTDNHCYQFYPNFSDAEGYVYFKIISDTEMKVKYSEIGTCPSSFQEEGSKKYYR